MLWIRLSLFLMIVLLPAVLLAVPAAVPPIAPDSRFFAIAYEHCGYRGLSLKMCGPDDRSSYVYDLGALKRKISAIQLKPGYRINMFDKKNNLIYSSGEDSFCLRQHPANDLAVKVEIIRAF